MSLKEHPFMKRDRMIAAQKDPKAELSTTPYLQGRTASSGSNCSAEEFADTSESSISTTSNSTLSCPQPEKITARPVSRKCSPEIADDDHERRWKNPLKITNPITTKKKPECNSGLVRVSLVAAPKEAIISVTGDLLTVLPNLDSSSTTDVASDTSSQTSTVFSFPWDLPPPLSMPSSVRATRNPHKQSTPTAAAAAKHDDKATFTENTPSSLVKWVTLRKHLSRINDRTNHDAVAREKSSTEEEDDDADELAREDDGEPDSVKQTPSGTLKRIESPLFHKAIAVKEQQQTIDLPPEIAEDGAAVYERIDLVGPHVDVRIPHMGTLQNHPQIPVEALEISPVPTQYVYAEVRRATEIPAIISQATVRSPLVPQHPSKQRPPIPHSPSGDNPYEIIFPTSDNDEEDNSGSFQTPGPAAILAPPRTDWWKSVAGEEQQQNDRPLNVRRERTHHLERFVWNLVNDEESAFSSRFCSFVDSVTRETGQHPHKTLERTRQFIQEATDFLVRGALQRKHPDLVAAVESEVAGLNGLQFLDVARELEILVQSTVLRPLHAKLTDDLERCGNGSAATRRFVNFVVADLFNSPQFGESERDRLEKQVLRPVKQTFSRLQSSYQPGKKLDYIVKVFRLIDAQIQPSAARPTKVPHASLDMVHIILYAVVFALTNLLTPQMPTADLLSPIEVQRLYTEGLISQTRLLYGPEGCRRLTDIVCVLFYVNHFDYYRPPPATILGYFVRPPEDKLDVVSEPLGSLPKLPRSLTIDFTRPVNADAASTSADELGPSWDTFGDSEAGKRAMSTSFLVVLVADEVKRLLEPYQVPLRQSLTVRELCNFLAYRLKIFDSKEFGLFYHIAEGDIPMTDGIRLQSFLNEHTSTKTEAIMNSSFSLSFDGNQDACDTSTSNHIVVRKLSGIRKLFQTRKQSKNSQQQERTRQLSQEDLLTPHQKPSRKRTQSHDWNCPLDGHGRRDTPSVFIYRRLTSELVLYASDLLQHLPATGTLI